jgi:hypothetical protein
MIISEIAKPITAKMLNESLAKKFGQRIKLETFTLEQLQDARNKIRTTLSQVETNESFDVVKSVNYQKSKMYLDVLNQAIKERADEAPIQVHVEESVVTEGAEDHAELVMAAKDMVDRVTGWMEDTAEMQTESMLELADAIRDELGAEQSETFVNTVKPALEAMYTAMEATRISLTSGVGTITGEGGGEMDTMGADPGMDDMDMEPTVDGDMDIGDSDNPEDLSMDDDFGADAAAAGGEEAAGRAKRESVERSRKIGQILSKKK